MPIEDSPSMVPSEPLQTQEKIKAEKFGRQFLLLMLVGVGVIFFSMVKIFLVPLMLAAVFAGLFYPLYQGVLKTFRNNRGLSAFVCCLVLLLGLLIPAFIVADLVSIEAVGFYQTAEQKIQEIIQKGDEGMLGTIKQHRWVERLGLNQVDWKASVQDVIQALAKLLATVVNKASRGTFQLFATLILTFFALYYFFKDGDRLIRRLKYLIPLADRYNDALFARFISVSRATIKGTLLVGLIKGVLGGLTFWIFGVSSPVLWGVVMVILSIIPMVGSWLVMYPAAIIQIVMGNVWQGIAIFLVATFVINSIDNILLPRLVSRDAGLHGLIIFFSTLGGLAMFGVIGFIMGPVIAALFLSILEVYGVEFKTELELAHGVAPQDEHKPSISSPVT